MVQVSYPGVYIEEVSSGVHTITGVSTSIAAFFGRTQKGQINKAVRCHCYADFLREFGGPHPLSDLGASVNQFFGNGGTDCYVVRIAHNPKKAEVTLHNLYNVPVLKLKVKNEGLWGNNIRLIVDYNTLNPEETFNLTISQEENGKSVKTEPTFFNLSMNPLSPRFAPTYISQSSTLVDIEIVPGLISSVSGYSESRRVIEADHGIEENRAKLIRDFLNPIIYPAPDAGSRYEFDIRVDGGPSRHINLHTKGDPPLVQTTINGANSLAAEITKRINNCGGLPPNEQISCSFETVETDKLYVLRITSATADKLSVNIFPSSSNDLAAPLMLGIEQGGIESVKYSDLRPAPTAIFYSGNINELTKLLQTDNTNTNNLVSIKFNGAPSPNDVTFVTGASNIFHTTSQVNDRWYKDNLPPVVNNINGHSDGVREKLALLVQTVNNKPDSPVTAELWGYRLAFKPKTGLLTNTYSFASANIKLDSQFKSNIRQYALGKASAGTGFQSGEVDGAEDDGNPLQVADYTGNSLDHTGFYALDHVDLFNLMILPGDDDIDYAEYQQLFGPATTYCEQRRTFLLLDAPSSWTKGEKMDADAIKVNSLRNGIVKQNSAIFYPRVQYSDAGIKRYIGPSGMIAGLIARTDSQRGVWKAPAGTEAELRNVLDVELNMNDNENGVLNKLGVNCIRKFPNGIVNWGARTLDGADDFGSEWKYIPIRRLALFLEESLFRGTKWVVFEPNDEPLWTKIRLNIKAFMMGLFRQGAFQGSTPDKAFFVKCDGETTTANDRNLGIVNIIVGFAPLKPAEFVVIQIQQIPDV